MKKLIISMAVDGRIDVPIEVPDDASREDIRRVAKNAFANIDLSEMDVVGIDAVNASDAETGDLLFDF